MLSFCRYGVWLGRSLQWFKSTIGMVVPSRFESYLHYGGIVLHPTTHKVQAIARTLCAIVNRSYYRSAKDECSYYNRAKWNVSLW